MSSDPLSQLTKNLRGMDSPTAAYAADEIERLLRIHDNGWAVVRHICAEANAITGVEHDGPSDVTDTIRNLFQMADAGKAAKARATAAEQERDKARDERDEWEGANLLNRNALKSAQAKLAAAERREAELLAVLAKWQVEVVDAGYDYSQTDEAIEAICTLFGVEQTARWSGEQSPSSPSPDAERAEARDGETK